MNKQTLSYDEETRGKTVINHMGGVFLYNRPEQILEQYELEVKSISRGRDSYQCDTEQGPKILREYRGSKEQGRVFSGYAGSSEWTGKNGGDGNADKRR